MPGGQAGATQPPVFVSEAAYTEQSVAARWLHRVPTAAEQQARAGAAAALNQGTTLAQPSEAQPEAGRGVAGGSQSHSALSWEEHAWFLRHSSPDAAARLMPAEHKRLQLLSDTVAAEQAAYARERASSGADADALRFMHPHVAEQVETKLERRRRKLRSQPSRYVAHGEVCFDNAQVAPQLLHQRLLKTRGCSQMLANLPPGTQIPTSKASLTPAQLASLEAGQASVSADSECASLAAAENARVVLASGAFKCLASTLPGQEWELPVTVRSSPEGGETQTRVFVDGPLLAPCLSLRTKNELFYKHAVLRLAVKTPGAAHEQEHQYRLWRFGDFTVLTRCREHALLPSSTPGAPACSAVVRVKLEYAPQLGWEEVTAKEREGWWAALMLRPGATMVVWRVGLLDSALLAAERKDLACVLSDSEAPGSRLRPATALSHVHAALQYMQQLPEGTYLLRRTAGSSVVQCLRALPDSHAQAADIENIHDATAKRRSAGATDAENLDFVPIRWQASQPGVQQIPFTHPPVGQPSVLPRRAARQKWLLAGSSPPPFAEAPARSNRRQPPAQRRADIRYCHAFAEGRTCRAGERCTFPHLTAAEVEKQAGDPYLSQLREYMTAGKPAKRQRGGMRQ